MVKTEVATNTPRAADGLPLAGGKGDPVYSSHGNAGWIGHAADNTPALRVKWLWPAGCIRVFATKETDKALGWSHFQTPNPKSIFCCRMVPRMLLPFPTKTAAPQCSRRQNVANPRSFQYGLTDRIPIAVGYFYSDSRSWNTAETS